MMKKKILIVDDDQKIRDLLCQFLEKNDYTTMKAKNVLEAFTLLSIYQFDLILLDIMMPGEMNGLDLAQKMRADQNNTPIIFLTAKDEVQDKITGLNAGGDDYMVKPFEPEELLARMETILRRVHQAHQVQSGVRHYFGDIVFDAMSCMLIDNQGNEISLSSTEQQLLKTLSLKPYYAFSREELASRSGFIVNTRTIDVQITRLRKKLNDHVHMPKYIKTIRHVGYALYPDQL